MASAWNPKQWWEDIKNLPTWGKVLLAMLIVGVIAFALYMRSKSTSSTSSTSSTTGSSSGTSGTTGNGTLTTTTGASGTTDTTTGGTGSTKPDLSPTGNCANPPQVGGTPVVSPSGGTSVTTTPAARRYVHVTSWPNSGSSLYSIAQANHMRLNQLEADNPQIPNPNLVYAGEKVYLN